MDKVDDIGEDTDEEQVIEDVEEQVIEDVGLDEKEEEEEEDQSFEIGEETDEEEDDDDDDEDVYMEDLQLHPKVTDWVDFDSGKSKHGIKVMNVPLSTNSKRFDFDLCSMCCERWTLDQIHQMSCLPCGHFFGMSCIKIWMQGRSSSRCPQCAQNFSLEGVRLLYLTNLRIPAAHYEKADSLHFSFTKKGFTNFKLYERELRTDAINNRSHVLKQRLHVLGRQNDAMKRRTELLNRMADMEKRVDVLERQNDSLKRELLNPMTDEEEWADASEQQADAEKRAEVLRRKAGALAKWADEYLRKADAFGQQAKSLRQEAKSLGQLVDSYVASKKFYIQSYKEFFGWHGNKITE